MFDITNFNEAEKEQARGSIKFFMGDHNNMPIQIKNGESMVPAGGIYLTEEILQALQEELGKERVYLEEG